jgi:hypothetical protein
VGLGPLPVRVVLVSDSNPLLMALGLPRTISCMAYEQSPLDLFLWYKPQGTGHRFPHPVFSSSYQRQHSPALSVLITLGSPIWEKWLMMMTVESALVMRAQAVVAGRRCPVE